MLFSRSLSLMYIIRAHVHLTEMYRLLLTAFGLTLASKRIARKASRQRAYWESIIF